MEESTIELGTMVLERHRSTYQVRLEGMRPHELPSAAATLRFVALIERRWLLADAQAESIPLLLQINGRPGVNRNRVVVDGYPVDGASRGGATEQTSSAAASSGGQSTVASAREPTAVTTAREFKVDGADGTSAPARTETQQTSSAPTVATDSASHSAPTGAGEAPRSRPAVVAEHPQPEAQGHVLMVDPPLHSSQAAAAPSPTGHAGAQAKADEDRRTVISASMLGGEARQPEPAAGARTEHAVVVPEQGHPGSTPAAHPPSSDSMKLAPVGSLIVPAATLRNDAPAPPAEVASQSGAQSASAPTPVPAQQSPPIKVVVSINLPPAHVPDMQYRDTSTSRPSSQASAPSHPLADAPSTAAASHDESASASTPHAKTAHPAPAPVSAKPDEPADSKTSVKAQDLFTSPPPDPVLLAPAAATPHSPAQTHTVTSAAGVAVHHDPATATATAASANASSAIDLAELKTQILRTLARDIALEAERRGVVSWDF